MDLRQKKTLQVPSIEAQTIFGTNPKSQSKPTLNCRTQIGATQNWTNSNWTNPKLDQPQMGPTQNWTNPKLDQPKSDQSKLDQLKLDQPKIGPTKIGPTQIGTTQIGPTQVRPTQIRPTQKSKIRTNPKTGPTQRAQTKPGYLLYVLPSSTVQSSRVLRSYRYVISMTHCDVIT